MRKARQTFERRQLGLALRRFRLAAGTTQQAAAEAIGRARSRIVEVEDGIGALIAEDLVGLLDFYQVSGEEREAMLALGTQARRRQRNRRPYVDVLPKGFERFADLEESASRIDVFESGVIAGLLQSPDYIRVLMEEGDGFWWSGSDKVLEERISSRLDRQATVLGSGESREFRFVLTEESLRADFGLPELMRGQVRHMLKLADEHPGLAIRVLLRNARGNPLRGSSLWLFGFGDRAPAVGYSAAVKGPSTYYDDEADVAVLKRAFERVWELALPEADSERFVRRMLEE